MQCPCHNGVKLSGSFASVNLPTLGHRRRYLGRAFDHPDACFNKSAAQHLCRIANEACIPILKLCGYFRIADRIIKGKHRTPQLR